MSVIPPVLRCACLSLVLICWPLPGLAEQINIAVASNFLAPLTRIQDAYERESDNTLLISSGSTGSLYAQIRHGAPFDLFLAADREYPRSLVDELNLPPPFIYAYGSLALWSPAGLPDNPDLMLLLNENSYRKMALANPALAPYGLAAQQSLESLGLWQKLQGKAVLGQNISQTYAMVASGNAELGFVALSQLLGAESPPGSHTWMEVPHRLYAPIAQAAAVLSEDEATLDFIRFLQSPAAEEVLLAAGYNKN